MDRASLAQDRPSRRANVERNSFRSLAVSERNEFRSTVDNSSPAAAACECPCVRLLIPGRSAPVAARLIAVLWKEQQGHVHSCNGTSVPRGSGAPPKLPSLPAYLEH